MAQLHEKFNLVETLIGDHKKVVIDQEEEFFFSSGSFNSQQYIKQYTDDIESKVYGLLVKFFQKNHFKLKINYHLMPDNDLHDKLVFSFYKVFKSLSKVYLSQLSSEKTYIKLGIHENSFTVNITFSPKRSKQWDAQINKINKTKKGSWGLFKSNIPRKLNLRASFSYYSLGKQIIKQNTKVRFNEVR